VNQAFDAMSFWGTVVVLLLILLVGCAAELVARIAERRRKDPPLHGPDSCLDAIADQDKPRGVAR
jgi:hypothetical protein